MRSPSLRKGGTSFGPSCISFSVVWRSWEMNFAGRKMVWVCTFLLANKFHTQRMVEANIEKPLVGGSVGTSKSAGVPIFSITSALPPSTTGIWSNRSAGTLVQVLSNSPIVAASAIICGQQKKTNVAFVKDEVWREISGSSETRYWLISPQKVGGTLKARRASKSSWTEGTSPVFLGRRHPKVWSSILVSILTFENRMAGRSTVYSWGTRISRFPLF